MCGVAVQETMDLVILFFFFAKLLILDYKLIFLNDLLDMSYGLSLLLFCITYIFLNYFEIWVVASDFFTQQD